MKRAGRGVIEVNSDFGAGEFDILQAAAVAAGRPLSILLVEVSNAPDRWRETRDRIRAARAAGLDFTGQVGSRPIGVMWGLETSVNPFSTHPAWVALDKLDARERYERIKGDPDLRRVLVQERPDDAHARMIDAALPRTYSLDSSYDYEPDTNDSIAARAARLDIDPWALALDTMLADEGKRLLTHTFENYHWGNLEAIREMIDDDCTVMGLGDGGAHVCTVCDASAPTFVLQHWARDRKRGARLPLEYLVRKQTSASARSYGLHDRGVLAPGYRADVNVIDFDRLKVMPHEVVYDLPAGGKRLMQRAQGYRHTFVAGVETVCDDEHTGALPGHLLR